MDDVCSTEISEFSEATEDDARTLVCKPMAKSCHLDPIPAVIMKGCSNTLLPNATNIVNLQL